MTLLEHKIDELLYEYNPLCIPAEWGLPRDEYSSYVSVLIEAYKSEGTVRDTLFRLVDDTMGMALRDPHR